MLYIFNELELLEESFCEAMMPFLSEERRLKTNRLQFPKGKNASVAAYLLLRIALDIEYGINEAVEFEYLEKGKPVLKNYPLIHFNLSHTNSAAACVVSDQEVGIDIQNIRSVTNGTARRVLTEAEYMEFKSASNPDEYFCYIWTIKEGYMKKTGQGIAAAFNKLPVTEINDFMIFREKDYFCSVCGYIASRLKIRHIGREDFEKLCN